MSIQSPSQQGNGLIRCYNMFPSYFAHIHEMTAYLKQLKKLGANVVWVNPLSLAGETVIEKSDPITAQNQAVSRSLYAMADMSLIDPRFSVVKRDADGDIVLTMVQIALLNKEKKLGIDNVLTLTSRIKTLREEIEDLEVELSVKDKEIVANESTLKKPRAKQGFDYELFESDASDLKAEHAKLTKEKAKLNKKFNESLLLQKRCIQFLDGLAMKEFASTAKNLGITPIFDLVVNHVANDAPIVQEHKDFFNFADRTYHDATAFSYTKLLGPRSLSAAENEALLGQIPTIFKEVWLPLINQYVGDWGFGGVRVDCVRKIPHQLRTMIYSAIRKEINKQVDAAPIVILEESLFSELSPQEFVSTVQGAGATHNMGSVYYKQRLWHGGLPQDPSFEDHYKKSMVEQGVINFTGIHDHFSCAMTVCRDLAFERLQENAELYQAYLECLAQRDQMSEAAKDSIKSVFIHHYVKEIIEELHDPDNFNEQINRFGLQYRDKFLTSAFSGSGGYYMMSGDEFASLRTPSVFLRANGQEIYPNIRLRVFEEYKEKCDEALTLMAEQLVRRKKYRDVYARLSPANKQIFLSATKEQLYNETHSIQETKDAFVAAIKRVLRKANIKWRTELLQEVKLKNDHTNGWQAPESLSAFTPVEFFAHTNSILSKLPASQTHYWSELFKAVDGDVLVAVRVNGLGYAGPTDVIIFNLNPHKTIDFSLPDIEKISQWLQQRGFPVVNDAVKENPDFHKAKGCIMGSTAFNQAPANLYFGGYFYLEDQLLDYSLEQNNTLFKFNIVVHPQRNMKPPLSPSIPAAFIAEKIPQALLDTFNRLKLNPQGVSTRRKSPELPSPSTSSNTEKEDIHLGI